MCDSQSVSKKEQIINKEYLHEQVLRIRLRQIEINKNIFKKKYSVPIHLALGHEAISVAVKSQFKANDQILLTHRNLHYHLAFGVPFQEIEDAYTLADDKSL
jgi:TPP-dependent pyruvate/acetoin dehydrogenase alpha subunit